MFDNSWQRAGVCSCHLLNSISFAALAYSWFFNADKNFTNLDTLGNPNWKHISTTTPKASSSISKSPTNLFAP